MMNRPFGMAGGSVSSKAFGNKFLTTAIVEDIDDKDGEEKLAKIKVRYLTQDMEGTSSDFIRVVTPMTGEGWGMCFWPEVGQEVLVAFLDGDTSKPYVLGSLFNPKNKPPVMPQDGKNDLRVIKTRSGHTLTFNDEQDKSSVSLITSAEQKIIVNDESGKESILVSDKSGDNSIEIKSTGELSIKAKQKIEIQAGQGTITLDNNGITIKGGNVKIDGTQVEMHGAQTAVKSDATLDIQATGVTTVKGASVSLG